MIMSSASIPENKCPDCLYMELTGRPKIKMSTSDPHELVLYLTINFNEQWEKLPGGYIKFGLKGGELRLELTHGNIPYEARNLSGALELSVQKARQSQLSTKTLNDNSALISVHSKSEIEAKAKIGSQQKKERTSLKNDTFTVQSCQVTTKGTPDNPAWVFEVQTSDPVLKGLLSKTELATIDLSASDWKIKASFTVPTLKDVKITEADGPWIRRASPAKRTALELGIAKLLLKKKLAPYLSQMELGHG